MANKKPKARKRSLKLHRLIILGMLVYLMVNLLNQKNIREQLETRRNKEEASIQKLEEEIKVLEEEISESDSLKFVEKVAREELGMVKPREIVVIDKNKAGKSR